MGAGRSKFVRTVTGDALMSVFNLPDAKNPSRLDGTNQRVIAQGRRWGALDVGDQALMRGLVTA